MKELSADLTSQIESRAAACGRARRDRLVQLVKHEQARRGSFFLEEERSWPTADMGTTEVSQ